MVRRPRALVLLTLLATLVGGLTSLPLAAGASAAATVATTPAAVPAPGTYVPVTPVRALDTRYAVGIPTRTPVPGGGIVPVDTTRVPGLPGSGVGAVVATVTVTGPQAAGYLTTWADGEDMPLASSLNWVPRQTVANTAVIPVGQDGRLLLEVGSSGSTHVVLDVEGYYAAGKPTTSGAFTPVSPQRVLDTRRALGVPSTTPLGAGSSTVVTLGGKGGPAAGAGAVVLNLTATSGTAAGYVGLGGPTALPSGGAAITWGPRQTVGALVVAPLTPDGTVTLYVGSTGSVHLVADLVGVLTPGARTVAGTTGVSVPYRQLDSRRVGPGLGGGRTVDVPVNLGPMAYQPGDVSAVVVTLTVTGTTAPGVLTGYATGTPRPTASLLTWQAGQTVSSTTVLPVDASGRITLYNGSRGSADVIVDLSGTVLARPVALAPGWTAQSIPGTTGPAGSQETTQEVSCVDSGVCALSVTDLTGHGPAGVTRRDGGRWAPLFAVDNAGGVACAGDGTCLAQVGVASQPNVVAVSTPSSPWSLTALPQGAGIRDWRPTCARRGSTCWLLGDEQPPGQPQAPYAARDDAGTWDRVDVPFPAGVQGMDAEVTTCADDTHCAIAGDAVLAGSGVGVAFAATWDGSVWRTHLADQPVGYGQFSGLAYRGTDLVLTFVDSATEETYADILGADGWSTTPVGRDGYLEALSCSGAQSSCVTLDTPWQAPASFVSVPEGTHTPLAAGSTLDAQAHVTLDCGASVGCLATGRSTDTVTGDRPVVVQPTDGAWASAALPLPADAAEARRTELETMSSCWGTTGCVVAWSSATVTGGNAVFVATRDDTP